MIETLDLRRRLRDRQLRLLHAVLVSEELEVAADDRERCPQIVRDDGDEVGARALELA